MECRYESQYIFYNNSLVKYRQDQHSPPHSSCFGMHWHERMEIIRVISGELIIHFGNDKVIAKAGELAIISPHQPHKGSTEDSSVKYIAIMFDVRNFYNSTPASQNQLKAIFDGRTTFLRTTNNSKIVDLIDSISINFDLTNFNNETRDLYILQTVYSLIYELYSNCLNDFSHQKSLDQNILKAIKYMENNLDSTINFSELSDLVGYNSSYFCQKFKENTGITPAHYLQILRLKKASSLLKSGLYTISEVAIKCGFNDSNYFTRCFKKYYNYTPSFFLKRKDLQIADKS